MVIDKVILSLIALAIEGKIAEVQCLDCFICK